MTGGAVEGDVFFYLKKKWAELVILAKASE